MGKGQFCNKGMLGMLIKDVMAPRAINHFWQLPYLRNAHERFMCIKNKSTSVKPDAREHQCDLEWGLSSYSCRDRWLSRLRVCIKI